MIRFSVGVLTLGVVLMAMASPAAAQAGGLAGRVSIDVNAAFQSSSEQILQSFGPRIYGENAMFDVVNDIKGGPIIDAGGSIRVWRDLSIGAAYTELNESGSATVTGTVPHPILSNNDRTIDPVTLALTHRERATHVYGAWRIPVRQVENLDVTVFGGPTYFNLTQGLVTGVGVAEGGGPPFSTVRVTATPVAEYTRNGWGGHAGMNVTYMVTSVFGVGGVFRFSNGSVDLPVSESENISVTVGGVQAGGGIRLRF